MDAGEAAESESKQGGAGDEEDDEDRLDEGDPSQPADERCVKLNADPGSKDEERGVEEPLGEG